MSLTNTEKERIRKAFSEGTLKTQTVHPETGDVSLQIVVDVLQHHTPHKSMITATLASGCVVTTTVDHSLFHKQGEGLHAIEASSLTVGDQIAVVTDGILKWETVISVKLNPPEKEGLTYDLSVPGPQNFVLTNGILAHNSYSIGGISLDIERSSKYMDLKRNAEEQWDKLVEQKVKTFLILRGLSQPKFGIGVRSAFGPHVSAGILSPRSFL